MTSHIRSRGPGNRCAGQRVGRDRGWPRFQRDAEVDRDSEVKKQQKNLSKINDIYDCEQADIVELFYLLVKKLLR